MKKTLSVILTLVLVFSLAIPALSLAEDKKTNVIIGYELNPGEPADVGANEVKRVLEADTAHSFNVQLYPSSQLGNKNDLIDQMLAGEPVITVADGLFLGDRFIPDFSIIFAPYLFETWDDAWALYASDWYAGLTAQLHDMGIQILASNWIYGARYLMTNEQVIAPADLVGKKIRVNSNNLQIRTFELLGATPTPMALGDVYTGLQQGTIEGLENTFPTMYNSKFYEVSKYILLDGMVKNISIWITGAEFYDSLTDDEKTALVEAMRLGGEANNKAVEESEGKCLELMKEAGVQVHEFTPEEYEVYKAATASIYTDPVATEGWSDNLYETVQKAMGK